VISTRIPVLLYDFPTPVESLKHPMLVVELVNWIAAAIAGALGIHVADPTKIVPDYLVMCGLITLTVLVLGLYVRSRLSIENPGRVQIVLEDLVALVGGMLDEDIGHKGRRYITLVATIGTFILIGNLMGLVPGLIPATMDINVTLGCALTVWVYYHWQGMKEQGLVAYLKHFAAPPGIPVFLAPIMLPIEVISHVSRVLSLSIRLFGNVFGEKLVVLILASIVPFVIPLPIMFLGVIIGTLQAFIFMKLTMIYLSAAVATEHH
jgi:F-type H+-transporting ATPase subunit a